MPEVTIDLIKALRERTGAGIMDCKKALLANDGDIEKSIDFLREKGIAKAATKAARIAAEGLANVHVCDKCGKAIALEVNCETDFVSSSDKFHDLVNNVTKTLMQNEPATLEDAKAATQSLFADATVAMGEKFDLRRFTILHKAEGQGFGSYIHMGGKIGVLVLTDKEDAELLQPLAMHIAANNPTYIELTDVPADVRAREKAIAEKEMADDPKMAGKKPEMLANIAERKVDKVLSASCLTLQPYLLDDSKTVGQVLKEKGVKVISFVRYQVGEGIAKRTED